MFQSLWEFVGQTEETQLDFFDLCEDPTLPYDSGLESQTANEEENGEKE